MSSPDIKMISISNVFSRMMIFNKAGDVELGHKHNYDHGTLVSSGSVKVDMLADDKETVISSKIFKAPTFIFVKKEHYHQLTALEDNTICACIHAIITIDDEIVDPDFLIEPKFTEFGDGTIEKLVSIQYNKSKKAYTA